MSPVTHFLLSWAIAEGTPATTKRERLLITLGGIIPDLDGLGAIPDFLTKWFSDSPTSYFHHYHHLLGHNVLFAGVVAAAAFALVDKGKSLGRRAAIAGLVCLTFHLHLLCDVAGSKGPDGSQWPIPYLEPFSDAVQWTWSGQWELNAWPNLVLTGSLILLAGALAVRRGYSFLGLLSERLDAVVVETLRQRFAPHLLAAEGEGAPLPVDEAPPPPDEG